MNGPASLASREIARRLPTNYSKSTFSGAIEWPNEGATAGFFGDSYSMVPEGRD
jgi:hypothetical protein